MRFVQATALALLVAGCGATMTSSPGDEPTLVNVPPKDVSTQIVGASAQQRELLLAALSGIGDRRIEKITIAKADAGWGVPDGIVLEFTPRPGAADDLRM